MKKFWTLTAALAFILAGCVQQASGPPPSLTAAPDTVSSPDSSASASAAPTAAERFADLQIELPAPACDRTLTPAQAEGPYYKAGSPERSSLLEPGMPGTRVVLVGYVLTRECQPIPNAWLDFWQADAGGAYDNQGYTLRGHQLTDSQGRYFLETVRPGEYPGRTVHIHVKVQPPGGAVLTTQLYFPDVAANSSDGIFSAAGLVKLEDRGDYQLAFYNFVLNAP